MHTIAFKTFVNKTIRVEINNMKLGCVKAIMQIIHTFLFLGFEMR